MIPWIALAVGSTLFTGYSQVKQGRGQENLMKAQARQEKQAAQRDELLRREELNRSLAASIAASGGAANTTSQAIALNNARNISSSESAESLSNKLRQDMLRRQGKSARSSGNMAAASTLLNSAVNIGSEYI